MSKELRIILTGDAKSDHDKMLTDIRSEGNVSINSSRLINWIVVDYFEHLFSKRRKKLCQDHFNSRKCVLEAMKMNDPQKMLQALEEATKSLAHSRELTHKQKNPLKKRNSKASDDTLKVSVESNNT